MSICKNNSASPDYIDAGGILYKSAYGNGSAKIEGMRLEAGRKYCLVTDLQVNYENDGIKGRYGVIDLQMEFSSMALVMGDTSIDIMARESEYGAFVPMDSNVYTLNTKSQVANVVIEVIQKTMGVLKAVSMQTRILAYI